MIDKSLFEEFENNGYVIVKGFYDTDRQVKPIQDGIRTIITRLLEKYNLDISLETNQDAMTKGYQALIQQDRTIGGEVYDAVKQIPAFMQLVSDPRNSALFEALRPKSSPGLAAGGYGIRIDNPGEEKFRAQWHQEFPSQLRSSDGIVFWSPLVKIEPDLGPVVICPKSHKAGIIPVISDDGGFGRTGAYALRLEKDEKLTDQYQKIAPLSEPGDLILMDFLTLHQSGHNISDHPRWSMQFRYFNFADPLGVRISWAGSFAAGKDFRKILPELNSSKSP